MSFSFDDFPIKDKIVAVTGGGAGTSPALPPAPPNFPQAANQYRNLPRRKGAVVNYAGPRCSTLEAQVNGWLFNIHISSKS